MFAVDLRTKYLVEYCALTIAIAAQLLENADDEFAVGDGAGAESTRARAFLELARAQASLARLPEFYADRFRPEIERLEAQVARRHGLSRLN